MRVSSLVQAVVVSTAVLIPASLLAQKHPAPVAPTRKAAAPIPSSGATRLGYVNSRAILAVTPGYAQAESTFTREFDMAKSQVAQLQAQLDSAATDFQNSSVLLSPTARQQKQQGLVQQQQDIEQKTQELQTRMQGRERELIEPIQSRVQAVIEGIRAEGNYAMIFDVSAMGGGVVAADRSLDLTQVVIDRLQASK
ncbi:MAG TPA: OmpH family outer membrane protein [Gemmatimonadales bacterium]|nr:OmpH family outer membrane protein [Gemmatimonadales bacterium]